jgi:hypothetical protein
MSDYQGILKAIASSQQTTSARHFNTTPQHDTPGRIPMFRGSDTNSFRYFLARFKSFARPQFWVAGLGLMGLLAFAWQFSQRPDWRQALTGRPEDNLSQEEKESQAIGAEIDSLPLLNADFNPQKNAKSDFATADQIAQIKLPQQPGANPDVGIDSLAKLFGGGVGNAVAGNGVAATDSATATLMALSRPSNNPLLGNSGAANVTSSRLGGGLGSNLLSGAQTPNQSNNQLAAALNRYSPATPNPNAPVPVNPSEPTPTPTGLAQYAPIQGNTPVNVPTYNNLPPIAGSTNVPPGGDSGLNSYTGLSSGAVPDALAPTTGALSGAVATPIPVNTSPIPVSPGSTPLPPGTATVTPPFQPSITPAPSPELPFTVPRSIPGRSIGGGEINTFSNP